MPGPISNLTNGFAGKLAVNRDVQHVVASRNGIVEDRHEIHIAVTDATGKVLRSVGDIDRMTLIRSAAKPMQALAIVESGAMDKFGLDDADLALACASHNSEDRHVDRARSILAKGGNEERHLACGGHPSILPSINKTWGVSAFEPSPVYSNCSGKHAAMLAAARAIGEGVDGYNEKDHPIQNKIQDIVPEVAGLVRDDVKWGIDGCNMATPAMPLKYLAISFARYADAADKVDRNEAGITQRTRDMARIYHAMTTYPELVAGEERFCTILMQSSKGSAIGKIGAAACYGIGIRESDATRALGATGAVGISAKVEDGSLDALYSALPEVLKQLDLVSSEVLKALEGFHHKAILNTAGVKTGEYVPYVDL